jgi:hypothetical protein
MTGKIFKTMWVAFTAFGLLLVAIPARAHHSFAAEFDSSKSVTIEGVITKVDWMNPHGWWHVDVTNPDGSVDHYDIQTESPNVLRRAGMTRETMGKPGDKVKILAYGARDGTKTLAIVRTITFEDTGVTFKMLDNFTR